MEDKELQEMKVKVDETHRMVSRLYKFEKNRRLFRVLKFVIFAVIIVGAYFAILPVFNRALDTYNGFSSGIADIQNFKFPFGNNEAEAPAE